MTCKPRSESLGHLSSGEQGWGHPQGWLMGQNLLGVQAQRHPSGHPHLTSHMNGLNASKILSSLLQRDHSEV